MHTIDLENELDQYLDKDFNLELVNLIKTGKEAVAYLVKDKPTNALLVLKVYKDQKTRGFQRLDEYVAGNYVGSRSMRQSIKKRNQIGLEYIQTRWIDREYEILQMLNEAGADVPEVFARGANSILMQYLGDNSGAAPKLRDVKLDGVSAKIAFERLLEHVGLLLELGIVHGDLSPFNILWWQNQAYIIDFPQALDINRNPNTKDALLRDIHNLCEYFGRYIEINEYVISEALVNKLPIPVA